MGKWGTAWKNVWRDDTKEEDIKLGPEAQIKLWLVLGVILISFITGSFHGRMTFGIGHAEPQKFGTPLYDKNGYLVYDERGLLLYEGGGYIGYDKYGNPVYMEPEEDLE